MCKCNSVPDPRDAVCHAERALSGLNRLLCELPADTSVGPADIQPLLSLICDQLEPTVDTILDYVPRNTCALS